MVPKEPHIEYLTLSVVPNTHACLCTHAHTQGWGGGNHNSSPWHAEIKAMLELAEHYCLWESARFGSQVEARHVWRDPCYLTQNKAL